MIGSCPKDWSSITDRLPSSTPRAEAAARVAARPAAEAAVRLMTLGVVGVESTWRACGAGGEGGKGWKEMVRWRVVRKQTGLDVISRDDRCRRHPPDDERQRYRASVLIVDMLRICKNFRSMRACREPKACQRRSQGVRRQSKIWLAYTSHMTFPCNMS